MEPPDFSFTFEWFLAEKTKDHRVQKVAFAAKISKNFQLICYAEGQDSGAGQGGPPEKIMEFMEGQDIKLLCPDDAPVPSISSAFWMESYNRVGTKCVLLPEFCLGKDVMDIIAGKCGKSGQDACKTKAEKSDLGEPCLPKKVPMRLTVTYSCGKEAVGPDIDDVDPNAPKAKVLELMEGQDATIQCPSGSVPIVSAAVWMESYKRQGTKCIIPPSFCQGKDLLELVGRHCSSAESKTGCKLWATRKDLGAPCLPTVPMRLIVTYTCGKDSSHNFSQSGSCGASLALSRLCGKK